MTKRKVRKVLSAAILVAVLVCAEIAAVGHTADDAHPASEACALCVVHANLGAANVSAAVALILDVEHSVDFEYSTPQLSRQRVESRYARGPPQAS